MNHLLGLRVVAFLVISHTSVSVAMAQQCEIRRLEGGLLHVHLNEGLNLIIQPDRDSPVPDHLQTERTFALGTAFDRTLLQVDGTSPTDPLRLNPGEGDPLPPHLVSVESVLIGTKRAGIQLKTNRLNIIVASVELMSDQSWITTHRDQDIHLLVLTYTDAARLMTARMNLWISLVKTQQILLNPTTELSVDSATEFSNSIGKPRVLPTEVLPVLTLPQPGLAFGDRQVILLQDAD
ncbi:hypothetical protein [Tautonia rosea]|uniref:hypothetical protein n=1 Tax=Tautonia rosea TaxID=2728037 RepID=UPI001473357F|nr:hypothetical protein [Tautonia rosea]